MQLRGRERIFATMGFFLPALLVGGLGMSQHLANKELDDLMREAEQPIFGFRWGFGLGMLTGLWLGISLAPFIGKCIDFLRAGESVLLPGEGASQPQQQR